MLLAIDIGNTNTVVGVFDKDRLLAHFRIASSHTLTVDEAGLFVISLFNRHINADLSQIGRIAICSVVPSLTAIYEQMSRKYCRTEPLTINSRIKLPFKIDYLDPTEVGADRLANAAAGYAHLKTAHVVVDIGTATTFDVVGDNGDYLGGVITPGPGTAGASLAKRAARLFEVRTEKPDRIIGKTTAEALKSGLFYGTIGMIDNILERIFGELGRTVPVLSTGGEAEVFSSDSHYIKEYLPTLTLDGIRIIAEFNHA